MASAMKTTKTVEVKQFVEKQTGVTLVLSNEEAVALQMVLNNIGGSPGNTPRGITNSINEQLNKIYPGTVSYSHCADSSLFFKEGYSLTQLQNYLQYNRLT